MKKGYLGYVERRLDAPSPAIPLSKSPMPPAFPLGEALNEKELSISGGSRLERLASLIPRIKMSLSEGKSVLILVPEGAFLAESASFLHHLPLKVLSRELSDRQRRRLFDELREDSPSVLLGSYLALLAPLKDLGHVVVLEHGSNSYKLIAGTKLFIPNAAQALAKLSQSRLSLSDALNTPEWHHQLKPTASIELPSKKQRFHIVNLGESPNWPLSTDLITLLKQVRDRERQALILSSRRGFSAALRCYDCHYLLGCPNCDLPLRYHHKGYVLRCHQCHYETRAPEACPNCQSINLRPSKAAGSEWILKSLGQLLPELPLFRFDNDHRDDLQPLYEGLPGIVVATSAIMRQTPLPRLSLIAHALLDIHFELGDFRSSEHSYRLLLNLAELSPQNRPLVVLQTFQPEHPVLQAFQKQDSQTFLANIISRRKTFHYPPLAK
ncbi:MAG: hypothetical protein R2865_15380 [Deinococcales bacterium]